MNNTSLRIAIAAMFALSAPLAFAQDPDEYADDAAIQESMADDDLMSDEIAADEALPDEYADEAAPGDVPPELSEPDSGAVVERAVPASNPDAMRTATYPIATGTLTARSAQPAPKPGEHVPPGSVEELDDNGDGLISESEARGNLALVNDFIHADIDRDNHVSASELARWKRG